jgi:hypothetical protein
MTTYQDQPLSRRQIREREAEAARAAEAAASGQQHPAGDPASASTSNAPAHPDATPEPLTYVTQGRAPLPQYDAPVAQPSAPPASAPPAPAPDGEAGFRYRDYSPEGRRAARAAWQAPAEPADLDYRTLNRPDAGIAPSAVGSAAPVTPVTPEAPPAVPSAPEAHSEATMSRRELRAFREAQEREQQASQPPVVSTPDAPPSAQPVHAAQVPYGSQAPVQSAPVQSAPVQSVPAQQPPAQQPPAQQPPASDAAPAWLAPFTSQEGGAANAAPQASAAPAPVPPPLVEPEEPKTDAVASLEALFRAQSGAVPIAPDTSSPVAPSAPVDEQPASEPAETVLPPWGGLTPGVPATGSAAPVASDASRSSAASQSQAPQPQAPQPQAPQPPAPQPPAVEAAPPPAAEPIASIPLPPDPSWAPPAVASVPPASAPPASAPPASAPPASPLAATSSQPPVTERPRNHWSRQAELDDESQPPTGSLARDVGVGPTTSNALVLPEIPTPDIMSTPLTSTGDVLVTGSISLPASLASTGALPAQLDESDLDNLLDPGDHQVTSTDSQPVRAVRAVSTHTSSREIIGTIKPKRSNRALTALIIAAAGMAVVVVSLLAVAIASGVLG